MSATTKRIGDDLKARVAAAAERAGKTTHGFIVDALAQTVEQAEFNDDFRQVADERWAKILATGRTFSWEVSGTDLTARAHGEAPRRPRARTMVR